MGGSVAHDAVAEAEGGDLGASATFHAHLRPKPTGSRSGRGRWHLYRISDANIRQFPKRHHQRPQRQSFWFTETLGNRIGEMTATGKVTDYPIPTDRSFAEGRPLRCNGTVNGSYAKFVVTSSKSIRRESSFSLIRKMKRGGTHYSIQCGFFIAPWHWFAIDPSSSDASPATRTCSE